MISKYLHPYIKASRELEAAIDNLLEQSGEPTIFRTELLELDPVLPLCSFCAKGSNQVVQMISENDVYICDLCVKVISEELLGECPVAYRLASEELDPTTPICSFCGKGSNQVTKMVTGFDGNSFICDQCLKLFCTKRE